MIGTWKINDEYSEILRRFWADENIVSINTLSLENSSSLVKHITVLVFSANCSESERKQVRRQLAVSSVVTTYIFNVNAMDNELNSVKLDDLFVNEFSWIDSLQIPVAKHCNLNCNRCYHFSNLVTGKEIYGLEEYKRDIAGIKQLAFSIGEVRFLGGEPLLNDNLLAYIEYMHLMFPYAVLKIVTNGLLITRLSPQQCALLSRMNVIISVSLYVPLHNRFNAIETFLISNGIRYEIFRVGTRFDKILLKNVDLEKAHKVADNCEKCIILYNGRIGRCAPGMFISDFNRYFSTNYPECNEQKLEIFRSSKDVLCYLDKEVPLCKWCTGDGQVESYPWSRSINIRIEDYIIDNSILIQESSAENP